MTITATVTAVRWTQREVGYAVCVVAILMAVGAYVGWSNAKTAAEDDAQVDRMVCSMQGRTDCDQPGANSAPWIGLAAVGGVVFLAGVILVAGNAKEPRP